MCILVAKFFPEVGWVGGKNRDRNYIPDLSFHREDIKGRERLLYRDNVTQYREGINGEGVCILSASLLVADDEKEVDKPNKSHSGDGNKISTALSFPTVAQAVKSLIDSKLTGNTLVFDKNKLLLLEASNKALPNGNKEYTFSLKTVPRNQTVARTNHGIELPWAGYQSTGGENEKLSRKSSESRLKIAQRVVDKAKSPLALLDLLCGKYTEDPQMNALRTSTDRKKMRTTAQILLVPAERTMYVRPIQSNLNYNFWKMDDPEADTWVEILSNKPLWQDHPKDSNGGSKLKHLS
jgi:hypothetical protein